MNTKALLNHSGSSAGSRRWFLALLAGLGMAATVFLRDKKPSPMAAVAKCVKPKEAWKPEDYYEFLKALPPEARLMLMTSSGCLDEKAGLAQLQDAAADARAIQKQTLWLSSNVLEYSFRDESKLDYHGLAFWAAKKAGVAQDLLTKASTFLIERKLMELAFADLWDKLTPSQREKLLADVDKTDQIKDKAAIASLAGTAALGALSVSVAFSGFAFYTTMSATIAAVASAMGVVLPFAVYTSASTIVGVLSGPVGWGIMAVVAIGGLAFSGKANLQKSTALLCQIHALKVEALIAAGLDKNELLPS